MKINRFFLLFFCLSFFSALVSGQTQQWVARYNGTANQPDVANELVVDNLGNAYIAGYAYDTTGGSGQDITVVKYDIDGNQLWAASHRDNGFSYAEALAVDPAGNVFVTGYSTNISNSSFIILKYNSAGVFQWANYYGASGSVQDEGMAIITDANYVYVTGRVIASGFPPYHNFKTLKIDIASGAIQSGWPQTYNGTGNNEDVPKSIAVDGAGNVFVTGISLNASGDKDYLTIGYDAGGNILSGWPQRFDGPDNTDDSPEQVVLSGNTVVVTGICNQGASIDTTGDICTIAYTYSGTIVSGWPQIYNGAANRWDGVGNTGSYACFKSMAVDGSGNVYVTGWTMSTAGNYDLITFKYDAAGAIQSGWPQVYDNGGNDDISRGLALDASNDVIITGWSAAPAGTFNNGDYITIEYDNAGVMQTGWPVLYNGTANGDDQAMAVVAVGAGIWITGYSAGTASDMTTIKYSNSNPTVGVKDLSEDKNIVLYPNPSTGKFIIYDAEKETQLTISNMLGEIICQAKINSLQFSVDLSKEPKGIYFYRLDGENKLISSGKIAVQ